MIAAYYGTPSEELLNIIFEEGYEDKAYINLLVPDERGNIMDCKYPREEDFDDALLLAMDAKFGIISNTDTPYPFAHEGQYGISLLSNLRVEHGDDLWGHLHALHELQIPTQWETLLQNKSYNRFGAFYLLPAGLEIWVGIQESVWITKVDNTFVVTNSSQMFPRRNINVMPLPKGHYTVKEEIIFTSYE